MRFFLAFALALALLFAPKCGRSPQESRQESQPYEDPAQCKCRRVGKQVVCNSACPPGVVVF